jgi:hypothetical protein
MAGRKPIMVDILSGIWLSMLEEEFRSTRFELTAFIFNMAVFGSLLMYCLVTAMLGKNGLLGGPGFIGKAAALGGLIWCLHTALSSLKTAKAVARQCYMTVPQGMLRVTTAASVFAGAVVAVIYHHFVQDMVAVFIKHLGMMTVMFVAH